MFGDIGTSPLYALQTVFALDGGVVRPTPGAVYGVISLVFWSITLVVSIKYVTFILRADNDGGGGIMALAALVRRVGGHAATEKAALVALGVFGASLFYGDSIITPAISVLSAVEGVEVAAPSLAHLIVPIALTILAALFAIQRRGTHAVGGAVRARDDRLVHRDRRRRAARGARSPRGPQGPVAQLRGGVRARPPWGGAASSHGPGAWRGSRRARARFEVTIGKEPVAVGGEPVARPATGAP